MFSGFTKTNVRVEKIFNYGQNKEKILVQFQTFVEIDHEIIPKVILLLLAESFENGVGQLQTNVSARSTG